jgi:large subunit ribosomal protein L17
MRHRNAGRKLGRNATHRRALMSNLVTSLFRFERIQTTDAKAKELRRVADKLITLGKRGDLHARRLVLQRVRDEEVVAKLFDDIAKRNPERQGGYTRIYKLGNRRGDAAPVAAIELVERIAPSAPEVEAEATTDESATEE